MWDDQFFPKENIKGTQTFICIIIVYFFRCNRTFSLINQTRLLPKKTIVVLFTGSINIEQCSLLVASSFIHFNVYDSALVHWLYCTLSRIAFFEWNSYIFKRSTTRKRYWEKNTSTWLYIRVKVSIL